MPLPSYVSSSLSAFSQYEFDLADLAGGRQRDKGRGDGFSVIQKRWGTVGERAWPLERQCMHSLFPESGELSKASGQPNLRSQSKEGECCFIFKDCLLFLAPCYLLQWGSSFRKSRVKTSPTKLKHSAFTRKWHQIFLSQVITLASCLTKPVLEGLALQASTSGR